jgi:hypothetical protein
MVSRLTSYQRVQRIVYGVQLDMQMLGLTLLMIVGACVISLWLVQHRVPFISTVLLHPRATRLPSSL